MIVGDLRNKVDSIWNTIWTGGITNPITAVEQITYLMFQATVHCVEMPLKCDYPKTQG